MNIFLLQNVKRQILCTQYRCKTRKTQTIADALIHRVFLLTGLPTKLSIDQDSALMSQVITEVLKSLECTMQIMSPWNHGSSKAERQIQTISNMISKHLSSVMILTDPPFLVPPWTILAVVSGTHFS